jgi:hypothetical protein
MEGNADVESPDGCCFDHIRLRFGRLPQASAVDALI